MAWAERRPNGLWRPCWYDANGAKRYGPARYQVKKAAADEAWEREREAKGVVLLDPRLTWAQWEPTWLAQRRQLVSANTYANNLVRVGKYLRPYWGPRQLAKIRTADVRAWVRGLDAAPTTIESVFYLFSASLTAAVQAEQLALNPCRGVALPAVPGGHERFLTPAELESVADWMEQPYSAAVELLAETGLRFGELAGLHWQHVDELHRRLFVHVSWSREGRHVGPTKGRKRRSVPLSARAAELLARLPRSAGTCGQPHEGTARCRSTLVIPSPEGLPLDSHNMRDRHWLPALELADVGRATLHDLRHTFASWCLQAGVPLSDVAEALGHSDAYVTRRYAHMADSHLARIRGALDDLRAVPSDAPSGAVVELMRPV